MSRNKGRSGQRRGRVNPGAMASATLAGRTVSPTLVGATPRSILELLAGRGLRHLAFGAGIGFCCAVGFGHFLSNHLFGVKPLDPVTYIVVAVVLAVVVALASLLPARRVRGEIAECPGHQSELADQPLPRISPQRSWLTMAGELLYSRQVEETCKH